MGKAFGLILIVAALYVGMTLYTEGSENAFGGLLAPITPASQRETPLASSLSPAAQEAAEPSSPAPRRRGVTPTQAVRERVTRSLEDGARRRGY